MSLVELSSDRKSGRSHPATEILPKLTFITVTSTLLSSTCRLSYGGTSR
jgi:hypothetical protein